jgi:hypothetical protein
LLPQQVASPGFWFLLGEAARSPARFWFSTASHFSVCGQARHLASLSAPLGFIREGVAPVLSSIVFRRSVRFSLGPLDFSSDRAQLSFVDLSGYFSLVLRILYTAGPHLISYFFFDPFIESLMSSVSRTGAVTGTGCL